MVGTDAPQPGKKPDTAVNILNDKTEPLWEMLDDWVAVAGEICTTALSFITLEKKQEQHEQQKHDQYEQKQYEQKNQHGIIPQIDIDANNHDMNTDMFSKDMNDNGHVELIDTTYQQKDIVKYFSNKFEISEEDFLILCHIAQNESASLSTDLSHTFHLECYINDVIERYLLGGTKDIFVTSLNIAGDLVQSSTSWAAVGVPGLGGRVRRVEDSDIYKTKIQNDGDGDTVSDYSDRDENIDHDYSDIGAVDYEREMMSTNNSTLIKENSQDDNMTLNPNDNMTTINTIRMPLNGSLLSGDSRASSINGKNTVGNNKIKNYRVKKLLFFLVGKTYSPSDTATPLPPPLSSASKEPSNPSQEPSSTTTPLKEHSRDLSSTGSSPRESSSVAKIASLKSTPFSSSKPHLWARSISYTHYRDSVGIFLQSKILSNHTQIQIMNIDMINNTYNNTNNVKETLLSKDSFGSKEIDSVSIIAYTDLSHLPYCQNCSYTTRYKFKSSDIENKIKLEEKFINNHEDDDVNDSYVYGTDVSIHLDISCPPSFYRYY